MKIKHKCKECQKSVKFSEKRAKYFEEWVKIYEEWAKKCANKCQCSVPQKQVQNKEETAK